MSGKGKKGGDKAADLEAEAQAKIAALKSKKKSKDQGLNPKLALVMKSGKFSLGYRATLRQLRMGKHKMIIISDNVPPLRKSEIEYFAMLSKTSVEHYPGNNAALGTACGKFYRVSMMGISDQGDSDILG
mmetsp:Transcript_1529/g.3178  ORF Transcript_1529/g.3178 Transcript_1529/m.3178 type:complete len:130 (+) Transcript_1529:150-539(+)|eukprot:CAMPEP_0181325190 /NCGR_PEP_ID=MMETSP1101-20121128/20786_1 /TAXON_ID=46948 /ORGANISM="Rhodomonas abbreviata, Strain Caron Lab Isolate" /LENGTH=129 /DNA_ID=CAMNT_0023433467 /DNA_START=150 /DNA_END=539 /DNA_ORIENTATION=+